MKTIIAGGRDYKLTEDGRRMLEILRPTITEVVCGKARGDGLLNGSPTRSMSRAVRWLGRRVQNWQSS